MNTQDVNKALSGGDVESVGVLPRVDALRGERFVFRMDFGLDSLPEEPGVVLIRGARQSGKSTWLQQEIATTVRVHGPGSAFYLTGDEIRDDRELVERIRLVLPLYRKNSRIRRLFVDEVSAVASWPKGLKLLLDTGELADVLVVTTGSKAADLRHGSERLPGRKGRLGRTAYLFTPVRFSEFRRVCGRALPAAEHVPAYLLSGGSPVACAALAASGSMPDYVVEMTRDWIYGEVAAGGRSRQSLLSVMDCLHRFGGTPAGQSKVAREAGLANNTVAAGYIELLMDLLCVSSAYAWDASRSRLEHRRPCKYHFTNLLAAMAWHPRRPRRIEDEALLPGEDRGKLREWLVAQELWRRAAVRGYESPEVMSFWSGGSHELDFVLSRDSFVEVKCGSASPIEFGWFPSVFPGGRLVVVSQSRFETDWITGMTFEDFLLGEDP